MSWSGEIRESVFLALDGHDSGEPSLLEAARSIPWDSIPRSFRGARFAMIMIFLFLRSLVL